jgi:hypothetical protein
MCDRGGRWLDPPVIRSQSRHSRRAVPPTRKLHDRLHTHRTRLNLQIGVNTKGPTCGALVEPSNGLEPLTPSLPLTTQAKDRNARQRISLVAPLSRSGDLPRIAIGCACLAPEGLHPLLPAKTTDGVFSRYRIGHDLFDNAQQQLTSDSAAAIPASWRRRSQTPKSPEAVASGYVGDLVEEMGYLCTRRERNCPTTSPYPPASVVGELKAGGEVASVIHRGGEPIAVLV